MDLERLNRIIMESGIKKAKICEALEISDGSLRNKLNGSCQFTWIEVTKLANILRMSMKTCIEVFFGCEVSNLEDLEDLCSNAI